MNIRPYQNFKPTIGARVFIDPTAVVIGNVTLGDDVSIWPTAVVRGDVNHIIIGARTNIQDGSVLHVTSPTARSPQGIPLVIGEDVTVGHRVVLHACTIANHCLIGMGSLVLDGAVLEDFVFVGAGTVVTPGKRLTSGGLYIGNPARRSRDLTDAEIAGLRHSASHYVKVKDEYRTGFTVES